MIADICLLISCTTLIVISLISLGFATGWALKGTKTKELIQHQNDQMQLLENIIQVNKIEWQKQLTM